MYILFSWYPLRSLSKKNNHTQQAIEFCVILFICNVKEIVCEQFLGITLYAETSSTYIHSIMVTK